VLQTESTTMIKPVPFAVAGRFAATGMLLVLLLLDGCATLPSAERKPSRAPAQPLERSTLPPTPPEQESLPILLAGQFALASGDLPAAAREFARAAKLSDDPALAAQATRIALAAHQWELAREGLTRWEALHGEDIEVWQARAILALHEGHGDIALQNLQRLADQADGKGWSAVAQTLLGAEDHAAAAALLEKLAQPDKLGDKPQTWIAMSQLAARLDRSELAQSLAEQALKRFNSADTYSWAAQLKLKNGDKAGARTLFADALRRNPRDAHLRIGYAALLGELGDNVEAARTLAGGPQDDYTYAARAADVARADDKPLTEALYREVKALPELRSPDRINLLGQLAELLERKKEALAWYEKVPPDSEHAFSAQLRRAVLLDDLGRSAEASALVHDLQARSGDDSKQLGDTYLLEAEMLSRHQQGEEAIATYDRGLQALPDDTRLLYARALLNDELNHVDAAVRDLRRVLDLKPDDASAMNALGYTLADRTDKKDEALDLIRKALTLKPDEPAIIDSMGWVQYRLGHLDAAIEQLRNAYGKQPDAEIAAHLGEVLWVSGQKDEARKVWDQGRKKDAKNKVLLETIQRLSS
jgi:tetratricopeptide (TPR) repeat protein